MAAKNRQYPNHSLSHSSTFQKSLTETFFGRENEVKQLHGYLDRAREGYGSFIVVSGEAGTGKTRLIREFAAHAQKTGANIIVESFLGASAYDPYKPFRKIVERLENQGISGPQAAFENAPTENSALSQVTPRNNFEIETLYSLQTNHRIAQQRIINSLIDAASRDLQFFVLMDVHLASITAWQFIHYLSESITDHKMILIVTLRQDGREIRPGKIPVYSEVLQRMNRERLIKRVKLQRFSEETIRRLLTSIFKCMDFSSRFSNLLYEVTGGLPKHVFKSLQILQQEGMIYQQNGIWFNADDLTKEAMLKLLNVEYAESHLSRQVKQLPQSRKEILKYAALFHVSFDYRILADILNTRRHKIFKELQALSRSKLLININENLFQFKFPIHRLTLVKEILPSQRTSLHGKIAKAIEQADFLEKTEQVNLLAYHYAEADEHRPAFRYLNRAGDLAMSNYAFTVARDFYDKAITLLSFLSKSLRSEESVQLLLKAAWVHRALGEREFSLNYYERALQMCSECIDCQIKPQILIHKGLNHFQLNEFENAKSCFEKCLTVNKNGDIFIYAMANYGLGNIYFELSSYGRSHQYFETALELAKEIDAQLLIANIYNNLGIIQNVTGNRLQAIAHYSRSIPIYEALDDKFGLARVYTNIGISYAEEKNWEQANNFYGKSLKVSDTVGLSPLKSITFLNRSLALKHLNRLEEAREYNLKAHRLLARLKDELGLAEFHKIQGIIEREQSNFIEAKEHLDVALEKFSNLQNNLGIAEVEFEQGVLAKAKAAPEEMTMWFNKAIRSYRKLGLKEKIDIVEQYLNETLTSKSEFSHS